MIFYQVNNQGSGAIRYIRNRHGVIESVGVFVADELYTEQELNHFIHVDMNGFIAVQIPARETYWFMGGRFHDIAQVIVE